MIEYGMDIETDIQHGSDGCKALQQSANISLRTFSNPIQPLTVPNETNKLDNALDSTADIDSMQAKPQERLQLFKAKTYESQDSAKSQATINKAIPARQEKGKAITDVTRFFQKTQKLLQYLSDLSIFDSEILQKGMKIDLSQGDSDFFVLHIGSDLHLACAYAYVLDERAFIKKDSPDLHFMRCEFIQKTSQDLLKICVPTKNSFDYRVRSNGVDTRLFYEHPLRICPLCIAGLCDVLSKRHKRKISVDQIKENEVMMLLFKNKLKNLVM